MVVMDIFSSMLSHSNLTVAVEILCRYLMDPKMEFVKNFGKNNDVDSLTNGIIEAMKKYKH